MLAGVAVRLANWRQVFTGGGVRLDQIDGWYHLRRAWLTLQTWPRVPQSDPWLNAPFGGTISWPPLFDGLLATLALPWRSKASLEVVGALLPVVLGTALLVALYALVRALSGERAALIATAAAAVLPGVVRYTRLGALDHDPFFELCVCVALWALASREGRYRTPILATAIAAAFLGWAGSIVLLAIVGLVAVMTRDLFDRVAIATAIAAMVILPFALTSVWRTATFEGLSLLHLFTLVAASAFCAFAARSRRLVPLGIAAGVTALALAPAAIMPLLRGVAYAAGENAILAGVSEARPLLMLFGTFDVRPLLVRLTLVPLLAIPFCAIHFRDRRYAFLLGWLLPVTALALLHSRFSFSAAVATCAAAGVIADELMGRMGRMGRMVVAAAALSCVPILTAYIPTPGWREFHLFASRDPFAASGFEDVAPALARAEPGVVFAPWSYGHWILWTTEKPVAISPMLSVGQSNFARALQLHFATDPADARRMLDRMQVRYLVVSAEPPNLAALAEAAGSDPSRLLLPDGRIDLDAYLQTVPGRLALDGGFGEFNEVARSRTVVPGPLGPVPLLRLYARH